VSPSTSRDAETAKKVVQIAMLPKDVEALAKYSLDMLVSIRVCEAHRVISYCPFSLPSSIFIQTLYASRSFSIGPLTKISQRSKCAIGVEKEAFKERGTTIQKANKLAHTV